MRFFARHPFAASAWVAILLAEATYWLLVVPLVHPFRWAGYGLAWVIGFAYGLACGLVVNHLKARERRTA